MAADEEALRNFYQQMVDIAQFRIVRAQLTGSRAEIVETDPPMITYNKHAPADSDHMLYLRNDCAIGSR